MNHDLVVMKDRMTKTGPRRRERRVSLVCDTPCDTIVTIFHAYYDDEPDLIPAMIQALKTTHGAEPAADEERAPSLPQSAGGGADGSDHSSGPVRRGSGVALVTYQDSGRPPASEGPAPFSR